MCGRFVSISEEQLKDILNSVDQDLNISDMKFGETFPTNNSLVETSGKDQEKLEIMNWGIKTEWTDYKTGKQVKNNLINARQETVKEKVTFKKDFQEHRCIIYASAFYEWQNHKDKYLVFREKQDILKFAGLYKIDKDNEPHFVIITQEATPEFMKLHNRLPLMLEDNEIEDYLTGEETGKWTLPKKYPDLKWQIIEKKD